MTSIPSLKLNIKEVIFSYVVVSFDHFARYERNMLKKLQNL